MHDLYFCGHEDCTADNMEDEKPYAIWELDDAGGWDNTYLCRGCLTRVLEQGIPTNCKKIFRIINPKLRLLYERKE